MEAKKTEMVLKVDLQCSCCYRKVERILCKYPEIRDQRYDEKANTVSIIVLTCCPEKIRDKLCYRGRKVIKSIDIKDPSKPKPDQPKDQEKAKDLPKENPKVPEKSMDLLKENPKASEKPEDLLKQKPKVQEKPNDIPKEKPKNQDKPIVHEKSKNQEKPKDIPQENPKEASKPKDQEKAKDSDRPKDQEKPKGQEKPKPAPEKPIEPISHAPTQAAPPMLQPMPAMVAVQAAQGFPPPVETGYIFMPSYGESYYDGPTYHGYGMPVVVAPPPSSSFDYYGQNYEGYENSRYVNRDEYLIEEEDSQGCFIM